MFLKHVDHPVKTPQNISDATVANWLKEVMKEAAVDTQRFKAHSIRSAASTKAAENGIQFQKIKKHANWSLQANTFENYYYKPREQHVKSRELPRQFFHLRRTGPYLKSKRIQLELT